MSITVEITDSFIVSDDLFDAILESVKKDIANKFVETLNYSSKVDESTVIVLACGKRELNILRYGENDEAIQIKGPKDLVSDFIQLMAVHGALLVMNEICQNAVDPQKRDEFLKMMQERLTSGVAESFEHCRAKTT